MSDTQRSCHWPVAANFPTGRLRSARRPELISADRRRSAETAAGFLLPSRGAGFGRTGWTRRPAIAFAARRPQICRRLCLGAGPAEPWRAGRRARRAKASAAGMRLIDFAERRIAPDEIKSAGYDGVVNYVSQSRPGANFEAKPLTRDYADALRAAGLHIVSNFQYGKPGWPDPSDLTRGYDGGVADAHTAMQLHSAAGGPNSAPIFFSVDDDIDANTWNGLAVQWFRGINSVVGRGPHRHLWAMPRCAGGRSETASSGPPPAPDTNGRGRRGPGRTAIANPRRCSTKRSSTARESGPAAGRHQCRCRRCPRRRLRPVGSRPLT